MNVKELLLKPPGIYFSKQANYIYSHKWLLGGYFIVLVNLFVTFLLEGIGLSDPLYNITIGSGVCPPYFQSCLAWLPSYSLLTPLVSSIIQMIFFSLLSLSALLIFSVKWRHLALLFFMILVVYRSINGFFFDISNLKNFDYFYLPLAFLLLFSKQPIRSGSIIFVLLYFFAASEKFEASWLAGTYFTSTLEGFPYFQNDYAMLALIYSVIFMELMGIWFLLKPKSKFFSWTLIYFFSFHILSISIVGLRYPIHTVPLLFLFFLTPKNSPLQLCRPGKFISLLLIFVQIIPGWIEGRETETLEGYRFGISMIDGNHQCISTQTYHYSDGRPAETNKISSRKAMNRCWIYAQWQHLRRDCSQSHLERINWTFDHSLNGGPFYRVVNVENACDLTYKPFSHNSWIQFFAESPLIGYPYPNYYRGVDPQPPTDGNISATTEQIKTSDLQKAIISHEQILNRILWLIWSVILFLFTLRFILPDKFKFQSQ